MCDRMNKFAMIAADITEQITSGAYKPGDRLPTIPVLCEQYHVSKITVKRAMDRLVMRGLVARRRGSGTFVRSVSLSQDYTQPESSMLNFKLHEFEVRHPSTAVAQFLRLDESEFVFHIHRTRIEDGSPPCRRVSLPSHSTCSTIARRSDSHGLHSLFGG